MGIDEGNLTGGQARKLTALQRSVGDELGEEVFLKWMAQQAAAMTDPVAERVEQALAGFAGERSFNPGVYGYTVKRARGKGATGFVATKNGQT